jgi:hypothetical protein
MENSTVQDPTASASGSPPTPASTDPASTKLSAVEIAAAKGIGPLSPLGLKVWHGEAYPCVSCGQLVRRSAIVCDGCGQDLSLKMIVKMQAHAGPWYVHEHVRPFPGVTLDRLIRQAQRGVLTATTIVRGPTTHHQWRFAAETPGLSKHLGVCWACQGKVNEADAQCGACQVNLDQPAGEQPLMGAPAPQAPPVPPRATPAPATSAVPVTRPASGLAETLAAATVPSDPPAGDHDLERIRAALGAASVQYGADADKRKRPVPMGWIIAAILAATVLVLLVVVKQRAKPAAIKETTPAATAPAENAPAHGADDLPVDE